MSFIIGLVGGILGVFGYFIGNGTLIIIGGLLCVGTLVYDRVYGGLNSLMLPVIAAVGGFLFMGNWLGILFGLCVEALFSTALGIIAMLLGGMKK